MLYYIKGQWVEESAATLHVAERACRFGDGVFESVRVHGGALCHLPRHLARLERGRIALRIAPAAEDISALCHEILTRNAIREGILRISLSRGIGSRGYLPRVNTPPTLVLELMTTPLMQPQAIRLWLSDIHKIPPTALPVQHKLMQGVNSTLARMEAADHGAEEALMLNMQGEICEASSGNIFWYDAEGTLHTPALECGVLAGICREILLEQWQGKVQQGRYPLDALRHARSVMIGNAITGPRAITHLAPQGWHWPDTSLADTAEELWRKA